MIRIVCFILALTETSPTTNNNTSPNRCSQYSGRMRTASSGSTRGAFGLFPVDASELDPEDIYERQKERRKYLRNQATESSNSGPSGGGLDKSMAEPSNSGGGGANAVDLNKAQSQQRRKVFGSNNYTSNPSAYQYHSPSPSADKTQLNQIAMEAMNDEELGGVSNVNRLNVGSLKNQHPLTSGYGKSLSPKSDDKRVNTTNLNVNTNLTTSMTTTTSTTPVYHNSETTLASELRYSYGSNNMPDTNLNMGYPQPPGIYNHQNNYFDHMDPPRSYQEYRSIPHQNRRNPNQINNYHDDPRQYINPNTGKVNDDPSESDYSNGTSNGNESMYSNDGDDEKITWFQYLIFDDKKPEFSSLQQLVWAVILGAVMGAFTAYWGNFIEFCVEFTWKTVPEYLLEIGVFTDLEGKFPLPYYMILCPAVFGGVSFIMKKRWK